MHLLLPAIQQIREKIRRSIIKTRQLGEGIGVYLGWWVKWVEGPCCEELNSWNYGQRPVIE